MATPLESKVTNKKKGPLRWEAIIPLTFIGTCVGLYFHFFFDAHLKRAIEWGGYLALGSEVNVSALKTSIFKASFRLQGLQITDYDNPKNNSLEIGDIRYSFLWDGLLRAKFVVNEAAVENIRFQTVRQKPGRVRPPSPPSSEPSFIEKEAEALKQKALDKAQQKYENNVFGDIAAILDGGTSEDQWQKLQSRLISKEQAQALEAELKNKQKAWAERIKNLPQGKDIQALGERLNQIKYKDFKSLQEVQTSVQQLDRLIKEADSKYKQIQTASQDLGSDVGKIDQDLKALEQQIKQDLLDLEKHFRLPKIDSQAITKALFERYTGEYFQKFYHYKGLAEKYLPPNLVKKDNPQEADIQIQPKPRAQGVVYEFGRPNSYPLFWIKKTLISSQAGTSPESGQLQGLITDITSNQVLTGKPTVAQLQGDFPGKNIFGLLLKLTLDNTRVHRDITLDFALNQYPLERKDLISGSDVKIAWEQAQGQIQSQIFLRDFKTYRLAIDNTFKNISYQVEAKNAIADEVLKTLFNGIPIVTVSLKSEADLPQFPVRLNSNLGDEIRKGLEKQIHVKIEEAKKRINAHIEKEVGQYKKQIESEINKFKNQFESELNKLKAQLDQQKKQAEEKTGLAKKDTENQIQSNRKKEEENIKKKLKDALGF